MALQQVQASKEILEEVLRVELSAADAYARAIERMGNTERAPALVDLQREHQAAAGSIRNTLARLHDRSDVEGLGIVGRASRAVGRVAALFGADSTLHALRAGEDVLLTYLSTVSDDEHLLPVARDALTHDVLAGVQRRIGVLDELLAGA